VLASQHKQALAETLRDVAVLRTEAAAALAAAGSDGLLLRKLTHEEVGIPQVGSIEALRKEAATALTGANSGGRLLTCLMGNEAPQQPSAQRRLSNESSTTQRRLSNGLAEGLDLAAAQHFRALERLEAVRMDEHLEAALDRRSKEPPSADALRRRARERFDQARLDGRLDTALVAWRQKAPARVELEERLGDTLAALQPEVLRSRALEALIRAQLEERLGSALVEMQQEAECVPAGT